MFEQITLPNGYWINGVRYQDVELRTLTGADEEFINESTTNMLPVTRVTALLTRCIANMDGIKNVTPDAIRQMNIGDCEAVLLHLRRITRGERLQCVLTCPVSDCCEVLDLELSVSDLLQPPYQAPEPVYEELVENKGQQFRILFHLPKVLDQEAAAQRACTDLLAGENVLLRRCVERILDDNNKEVEWSPELLTELPARMSILDPQAELILDVTCPACKEVFSTLFDAGSYLLQEIAFTSENLYYQVHLLALYYHWSESEIMSMNISKRQRYLNLLVNSLSPEVTA